MNIEDNPLQRHIDRLVYRYAPGDRQDGRAEALDVAQHYRAELLFDIRRSRLRRLVCEDCALDGGWHEPYCHRSAGLMMRRFERPDLVELLDEHLDNLMACQDDAGGRRAHLVAEHYRNEMLGQLRLLRGAS